MAWTIGAGSSGSTPFAPAVGANAISVMRAGFIVGLLGFAGAVLQGENVSETIGSGLILGVELTPAAVILGLFTAALLVAIGIFTGYPIATAFTVTGAVTGVGLALGGVPAWGTYQRIVALWILIPFVGGGVAYGTTRLLTSEWLAADLTVALLGGLTTLVVGNMRFSVFGQGNEVRSLAAVLANSVYPDSIGLAIAGVSLVGALTGGALLRYSYLRAAVRTERRFLLVLGCLVAFSAGATQVGLAIGPLFPIVDEFAIPTSGVLVFGGLGLLIGSWTGAPRMIKALSQDYSELDPKRSIAALVPSFLIAQTAVFLGIPVSFNEIMVSAIIGSGYAAKGSPVSARKMRNTVIAWIGSLCLSGICGYIFIRAFQSLF